MSTFLTGAALSVTRWWTRDYTIGTPHSFARARRAEIDSDLWEFERDLRQTAGGATTTWARLLLGVPDDLSWQLEQGSGAVRSCGQALRCWFYSSRSSGSSRAYKRAMCRCRHRHHFL